MHDQPFGAKRLSRRELRRLRANEGQPEQYVAPPAPPAPPSFSSLSELAGPPQPDHMQPTILTVCTGNICRSPMGEVLLRAGLSDLDVRVHSAGTHALVDHEMTEPAQQIAVARGASADAASGHRARYLTEGILDESDLILAMAREHRSYIVQLRPSVLRRTFTVREFGRLAQTLSDDQVLRAVDPIRDAAERVRMLSTLVGAQRGLIPATPDDDDVVDPYRRSMDTYERSAAQLQPGVDQVVRLVRLALA